MLELARKMKAQETPDQCIKEVKEDLREIKEDVQGTSSLIQVSEG